MIWQKALFLTLSIVSLHAEAENRITTQADPGARCRGNIPAASCPKMNRRALESGCINQEEYNSLESFGSFASCSDDPLVDGKRFLVAWCACGCFHPDTKILATIKDNDFATYYSAKEVAFNKTKFNLLNLTAQATFTKMALETSSIRHTTSGNEENPLVVLTTASGATLKLTEHHAVLLADGKMIEAKELRVGNLIVSRKHGPTEIVKLERESTPLAVVNFVTEAPDLKQHIVVAEDVFVGDLYWQSHLEALKNQITVRVQ